MNYHIITEDNSVTYFDCAETREEADEIAAHYMNQYVDKVCIYARDTSGKGYVLAMCAARDTEERRLVGFGRW